MTTLSFTDPPATIRFEDCDGDAKIALALALEDFEGNASLELWTAPAGDDCANASSRTGPTATCTRLGTGLPLALETHVDVSAASLSICGETEVSAASVQALYFAPGQTSTPSVVASVTLRIEADASDAGASRDAGRSSATPDPDDGGCNASGHPLDVSLMLGLVASALLLAASRRKATAQRGVTTMEE